MGDKPKRYWVSGTFGFWVSQIAVSGVLFFPALAILLIDVWLAGVVISPDFRELLTSNVGPVWAIISLLGLIVLLSALGTILALVCWSIALDFIDRFYLTEEDLLDWHYRVNQWRHSYDLYIHNRKIALERTLDDPDNIELQEILSRLPPKRPY